MDIPVADWAAVQAATPGPGDVLVFSAVAYTVTAQVALVSGVTYQGAAGGGTVLNCGGTARAFTAWATPGQTDWTIDGLTIQNGMSDADNTPGIADEDGGAVILLNGASGTISNVTFLDCKTDDAGDDGGAIKIDGGSSLVLRGCTITNCDTGAGNKDGGAIRIQNSASTLLVEDCDFSNCDAGDDGGAIDWSGPSVTIRNSTFTNCTANDEGGAVRGNDADNVMVLENCTFTGNSAGEEGGAVTANSAGSLTMTNCVFDSNTSGTDDAVLRGGSGGPIRHIYNNLFINNVSTGSRILDARSLDTRLINNTFVGNTAGSGPLVRAEAGGTTVVANNIFATNTVTSATNNLIEFDAGGAPALASNLYFGNTIASGVLADPAIAETNRRTGNPSLDAEHKPQAGSDAIDNGDTAFATAADIDGVARDANPDIGAYEFIAPPPPPPPPPTTEITSNINPPFIDEGDTVILTAPAGTNYQWFKGGAPLSGATSSTLAFDPIDASDAGEYTVSYNDGTANVATGAFIMTVNPGGSVPVSGLAGLIALAGACGLGGARLIRRRK